MIQIKDFQIDIINNDLLIKDTQTNIEEKINIDNFLLMAEEELSIFINKFIIPSVSSKGFEAIENEAKYLWIMILLDKLKNLIQSEHQTTLNTLKQEYEEKYFSNRRSRTIG
jgi:hypothetical protein